MAKNKKDRKLNPPLVLMGVALLGVLGLAGTGLYFLNETVASLQEDVAELRSEVAENANKQLSPKQFHQAVANSLEVLASKKMQEQVDARYAGYTAAADTVPDDKNIYGDLKARFTLVEFSDLECPYCKRFHNTPKEIVDNSNGNVNWQWKHLPLEFHNPVAQEGALAAECVREQKGNKGFWVFLDEFFKQTRGNGQGVLNMASVIEVVGADVAAARECMSQGRYNAKIATDVRQAANNGISGTPATFVVDNLTGKTQLLTGAQPAQAIIAAIRKMIAEHEAAATDPSDA
jgi:protein-disulfide isomerase